MKLSVLTACLILGWTQSSGQPIQRDRAIFTLNSHQVRAILKDHAELEMMRQQAGIDSIAYQDLTKAYFYKDSAFRASQFANQESDRIAQDFAGMYHESDKTVSGLKKEVRRQKRLRWLVTGGAVILLVLAH